jgi:hypothetical protein
MSEKKKIKDASICRKKKNMIIKMQKKINKNIIRIIIKKRRKENR